jgi:hypothetical protein
MTYNISSLPIQHPSVSKAHRTPNMITISNTRKSFLLGAVIGASVTYLTCIFLAHRSTIDSQPPAIENHETTAEPRESASGSRPSTTDPQQSNIGPHQSTADFHQSASDPRQPSSPPDQLTTIPGPQPSTPDPHGTCACLSPRTTLNAKIGQIMRIMEDVIAMAEAQEYQGTGTPQSADAKDEFLIFLMNVTGQNYLGPWSWQSPPGTPFEEWTDYEDDDDGEDDDME